LATDTAAVADTTDRLTRSATVAYLWICVLFIRDLLSRVLFLFQGNFLWGFSADTILGLCEKSDRVVVSPLLVSDEVRPNGHNLDYEFVRVLTSDFFRSEELNNELVKPLGFSLEQVIGRPSDEAF
jgi:hypothetical protein